MATSTTISKTKRAPQTATPAGPVSDATSQARRFCSNPKATSVVLPAGISNERARLILMNKRKWANGTTLHYYFFDKKTDGETVPLSSGTQQFQTWVGSKAQMDVVRKAFQTWKALGIGLNFEEVKHREEAELRIGFMQGDGSWSYIGRDVLQQPVHTRTMNFGWNIAVPDRHNGIDTALHEIGHALGFPHEHQNPFAGIVWDEPAVYAALAAPPNGWDQATTYHNIIKKLDTKEVNGSTWDPDSIMHYPFDKGLIKAPTPYTGGIEPAGGLSTQDKKYALFFYPALNASKDVKVEALISYPIDLQNSEQQNYIFAPLQTRKYTLQTFGRLDTVLVLNEQLPDGTLQYLSGDDNSGTDNNALIQMKLFRGRTYVIKLRLYYKNKSEKAVLLIS